jgi:hypothetical protein
MVGFNNPFLLASGVVVLVLSLLVLKQNEVNWSISKTSREVSLRSIHGQFVVQGQDDQAKEENNTLPPLDSLIHGTRVIGNVDFLLDFAIIGHAKTGTTLLQSWLRSSKHVRMHDDEVHALTQLEPARMVRLLYELPACSAGDSCLHGYKAPRDVCDPNVLDLIATYWPRAKLIVGLRHPIDWFESFYNYRYAEYGDRLPPPLTLVGECIKDMGIHEERQQRLRYLNRTSDFGVCTDMARFHLHLSYLGKTNASNDDRQKALLGPLRQDYRQHLPLHNPLFLYESSQLDPNVDADLFDAFQRDLEAFLGFSLNHCLGPPPAHDSVEANFNPSHKYPLDICLDEYGPLRAELLRHSESASAWIAEYLMDHPDVTVSSPDHFRRLIRSWSVDPCLQ